MSLISKSNSVAERLREARTRAGYQSASEFARFANINYTTYAHHENGRREIKPDIARVYARLLSLPAGTLLYGEQTATRPSVRIMSRTGAQGRIEPILSKSGKTPVVELPDPWSLVGTQIVGDDLYPAYRDGDVVFHRALRTERYDPTMISGVECVVELQDGTVLLRHVTVQADGRATLSAYQTPPLINQIIVAAAPVEIVQRNLPRRYVNH
jgi:DNA-binding XRE family transcriptional regulator